MCRVWNCRTWKWRTDLQDMKLQDMKMTDQKWWQGAKLQGNKQSFNRMKCANFWTQNTVIHRAYGLIPACAQIGKLSPLYFILQHFFRIGVVPGYWELRNNAKSAQYIQPQTFAASEPVSYPALLCPAISCPAFSCPVIWFVIFTSVIFSAPVRRRDKMILGGAWMCWWTERLWQIVGWLQCFVAHPIKFLFLTVPDADCKVTKLLISIHWNVYEM